MKQFLRFQISGVTTLLWFGLLCSVSVNILALQPQTGQAMAAFLTALSAALPIGTLIHQSVIALHSPFRRKRLFGLWPDRLVVKEARRLFPSTTFDDSTFQAITVYSRAMIRTVTTESTHAVSQGARYDAKVEQQDGCDTAFIREEISNRYSYYYVRLENGLYAPFIALCLFWLLKSGIPTEQLLKDRESLINVIVRSMVLIGLIICGYIPQILKELNDLEIVLLRSNQARLNLFFNGTYPSEEPIQSVMGADRGKNDKLTVQLEADVATIFPDADAVNEALRFLTQDMKNNRSFLHK
jgi:hypothetical protein